MAGKITQAAEVELSIKGTGAVKSLKTELREARQDAINFSRQFGEFSPQAIAATKRMAELKDEMEDFGHRVNALNPDKFSQIGTAAQSLAHGFSAAQGAAALFGAESENVQKAMMKVQGAMALSQGLMGLKDSKEALGALAVTIRTKVVAAFSTMKGAIMSTGIGALIVGIGSLIYYFNSLARASEEAAKELAEDSKRNLERTQANIQAEITLRKAAGKETLALEREMLLNELTANEISLKLFQDKHMKMNRLTKAFTGETIKLSKEQKDELHAIEMEGIKLRADITALSLTAAKKERDDQLKIAQDKADRAKQQTEKANQEAKAHREKLKKDKEQELQDEQELQEAMIEMQEEHAKNILEIENKLIEDKKKLAEKSYEIAQQNTADFYTADKIQLVNDLADKKITREEYAEKTAQLESENLTNMLNDAILYGASTLELEKQQADLKLSQAEAVTAKQIALDQKERESKMLLLNSTLAMVRDIGTLLTNEEGKRNKISKAYALAQLAIDTAQAISSLMKNSEANPTNAVTFGLAGAAQFASGIARIAANVVKATQLLKAPAPTIASAATGSGGGRSSESPQFAVMGQDIRVSKLSRTGDTGGTGDGGGMSKVPVVEFADIRKVGRRITVLENGGTL